MSPPLGLTQVALPMLELLLAAIDSGRLECPFREADLADIGFFATTGSSGIRQALLPK